MKKLIIKSMKKVIEFDKRLLMFLKMYIVAVMRCLQQIGHKEA